MASFSLMINMFMFFIQILYVILTIVVTLIIQLIKLLIYIIKNVLILDLFAVSSASSYFIYKQFSVSTTAGFVKTAIAGVVIGLILMFLTRLKYFYIGRIIAEAYGVFWGILIFLAIKHFWLWENWVGILVGIAVGVGIVVLHHFLFKNNIEDIIFDLDFIIDPLNNLIDKIKDLLPEKKKLSNNYVDEIDEIAVAEEPIAQRSSSASSANLDLREYIAKAKAELDDPNSITTEKINSRFVNIINTNDIEKLTDLISRRLNSEKSIILIRALIAYIAFECNEDEKNLNTLRLFLSSMELRKDTEYIDAVDLLFKDLEEENPQHFAVKCFEQYKELSFDEKAEILLDCKKDLEKIN